MKRTIRKTMRNITKSNIGSTIENTNAIRNTTYYRTMNNTSIKNARDKLQTQKSKEQQYGSKWK
jgi:hypothetical protein